MAVIHSGGDGDKTAHSQNADGAARVFVSNRTEYASRMAYANPLAHRWLSPGLLSVAPAFVYGFFFWIAGSLFPQFYQAWLDFCMPLVEYVAGLTPRAERTAGELTSGGYPERVDDAMHGIAMARVMLIPVYGCLLMALFYALTKTPPMVVSYERPTLTRIWLTVFCFLVFGVALFVAWEFTGFSEENFGYVSGTHSLLKKASDYHRSNFAIFMDMLFPTSGIWLFVMGCKHLLLMRAVRFNLLD